jgi:hypothetical protein
MSQDHFLAFKGLKQYTPEVGWESLQSDEHAHHNAAAALGAQTSGPESHQDFNAHPHTQNFSNARMNASPSHAPMKTSGDDPLINELFDQLKHPVDDELSKNWKVIASNVNALSQRMDQLRLLKSQLNALEAETQGLRNQILNQLEEVQHTAERQLSVARLRIEVSTLARHKLSDKLKRS